LNRANRARGVAACILIAGGWGMAEAAEGDVHSFGRPAEVRVGHIDLDLAVDFARQILAGHATITVARGDGANPAAPLVLDTRDLKISAVEVPDGPDRWKPARFRLGEPVPILGQPLTIDLPAGVDRVRIAYETSPGASALQWVEPAGTAGGVHPFLFSQSQAINARSWVPCQDSPGVRFTYTAALTVPEPLVATMAADRDGEPEPAGDGKRRYRFAIDQPIPSYLLAVAAGDLAFRPLGPRTGVYAEPSIVGKAADEFADVEAMVAAVEKTFGPYRWGRYDLLVLPPSFPFGGMENPKLTFATPTILAGDRSLVALVAHELAHSWSGNLVTNATWSDFWLNEGFTVYLERRIVEELYGKERAEVEAVLGAQELQDELAELPPGDQILHIDLAGRDPDDGVTRVPYEKGALFLDELERRYGRERFDAFLKAYFDRNAFRSITTAEFVDQLREHLLDTEPEAARGLDLDAWLNEPGLPADAPLPKSARLDTLAEQAGGWSRGEIKVADLKPANWSTQDWLYFLRALPADLPAAKLAELDEAYKLTDRGNSEIACQWLVQAIRGDYALADGRLEEFLTTVGRRKFLMPLYGELLKSAAGRRKAEAIYAKARPKYHPIAADSIDRLLKQRP